MKKIKMLKTMASADMTALKGQIINVEDDFARQLISVGACEILEDIIDVVDYVEVKEEEVIIATPVSELSEVEEIKPFIKKRK